MPNTRIESALRTLPFVEDCALVVRDVNGAERCFAYLVTSAPAFKKKLDELLHAAAPGHRVPDHYVLVNRIPYTPSGVPDEAVLAGVPIVDDALAAELETAL